MKRAQPDANSAHLAAVAVQDRRRIGSGVPRKRHTARLDLRLVIAPRAGGRRRPGGGADALAGAPLGSATAAPRSRAAPGAAPSAPRERRAGRWPEAPRLGAAPARRAGGARWGGALGGRAGGARGG